MKRNIISLIILALLVIASLYYLCWNQIRTASGRVVQQINCVNNLKEIGLAFRIWAGGHNGQYPFNVSTNAGGTKEFCAVDNEGFDSNAYLHLKALARDGDLSTPLLLICPQDRSKIPATNWSSLLPANITYRFHSGTNLVDGNSNEVLAICPIDGNTLYCDGRVVEGNKAINQKNGNLMNVR